MASILSAGTTSATAMVHTADTSGVLQLASNNGVVALTVTTGQDVGIGTTTSSGWTRTLAIASTASAAYEAGVRFDGGTASFGLGGGGSNGLRFYNFTSGAELARFTSDPTFMVNATGGGGGCKLMSSNGSNGWPVTSGTTQTYGALRLRGGDNAVIDFGCQSTNTWIQATDISNLGSNYDLFLNPNGGRVVVGTRSLTNYGTLSAYTNTGIPAFRAVGGPSTADGSIVSLVDKYSSTNTTSQWFLGFTISNQATASGVITANGASQAAFGSWSDRRLKENIVDLPPQLENILKLRPVEFDYIQSEGGGHQISFIAQEFEEVYPDAVGERPDGMKTLTGWSKTEARLVKAIQELSAKVTALENK